MSFLAGRFDHSVVRAFPPGCLRIRVARPFPGCAGVGSLRIIAERRLGSMTELVLSYEDYSRIGPPPISGGGKKRKS